MESVLAQIKTTVMAKPATKKVEEYEYPQLFRTSYSSLPVPYPSGFLSPLPDPKTISVSRIEFESTPLSEYRSCIALVLDNVFSPSECSSLLKYAEMSAGAHGNNEKHPNLDSLEAPEDDGWKPALVNAGRNHEVLDRKYRNSDRIIWDERELARRIWGRVLQGEGIRETLGFLGEGKRGVIGGIRLEEGEGWEVSAQGVNERLRFLRYGPGQFFREHCDGSFETEDGALKSFFTIHIYLNDSAQALGIPEGEEPKDGEEEMLRGGATTFHSGGMRDKIDVDPRIGRVLLFQHRRLLHSGAEVTKGIKYTVRSDIMYQFKEAEEEVKVDDGHVVFEN